MAEKTKNIQKKEAENEERIERTRSAKAYIPDVDIIERKDNIILMADMPGVEESGIDITLEKNILTIYGRVDAEVPENLRFIHAGYGIGDYQRSFTLSGEINRDKIKATLKNGLLQLILPKAEPMKAKKITVETGA
jgi:HSP20 family molecular chaperone IbpA